MAIRQPTDYQAMAQRMHAPFEQQAQSAMRARLADQGLLSSTGGQGAVQRTSDEWASRGIDWATQQGNQMQDFIERQRQFNQGHQLQRDQFGLQRQQFGLDQRRFDDSRSQFATQQALRAWEMQNALALSRQQFQGDDRGVTYPRAPNLFSQLYRTRYMGDPVEQRPKGDPWPQYAPNYGKGLAARQEDRVASDNAAQRALQERLAAEQAAIERERLAQARELADRDFGLKERAFDLESGEGVDPWDEAYNLVMANVADGRPISAQDIISAARMRGIDLRAELTGRYQNPRALAFLKLAAGEEWREVFEEITGQSMGGGGAPASASRVGSLGETRMGAPVESEAGRRFGTDFNPWNWAQSGWNYLFGKGKPEFQTPYQRYMSNR